MIIDCQNCNKKFDIDQILIPESGRLLQCNSCNHKWFFKNKITIKAVETLTNENLEVFDSYSSKDNHLIESNTEANIETKIATTIEQIDKNDNKIRKKNNFLNLTYVLIISFVALIILIDTFKKPLGKIAPNLEFILYNLYESIKDVSLFIKDLI